jgi:hypothetical protein
MPTLESFAAVTRKVIASEGFADYLPTVLYPSRKALAALQGAPKGEKLEAIAVAWAAKGAVGDEEFLVAFKVSGSSFKIVRRHAGQFEERVFHVSDNA